MRVLLDNIAFDGILAEDDLSIDISKGSTRSTDITSAASMTFTSDAFEYLKDKFFLSSDGRNETAQIKVFVDCCTDDPFIFTIRADTSTICFQTCEIISSLRVYTEDNNCYARLSSERFWESGNFININHPKIQYCDDRGFIQAFGINLISILNGIINAILSIIPGVSPLTIPESLVACGRSHPAPLVKDVLQAIADMCDLELIAPIFESAPYDRVSVVFAANVTGSTTPANWIAANAPDLTGIDFLELIKVPFNADYCIKDGKLILDRVDRLLDDNVCIGDAVSLYNEGRSEGVPCYTYGANINFQKATITYTTDAIDAQANPSARSTVNLGISSLIEERVHPYGGFINYNDPFDPTKIGQFSLSIPFAPITVVGDEFNEHDNVESIRRANGYTGYLRLEKGRTAIPKLVIVDITNPVTNEGIIDGFYNFGVFVGNRALWVKELYNNFFSIIDPRSSYNPYLLEDFVRAFDCDEVNTILQEGTNIKLTTELGNAYPERVSIDFKNKTITISSNTITQ